MKYTLRYPSCIGCPHNLYFGDTISKKQFGVMMHCGEHFCIGEKRARRIKRRDLKSKVPVWCPKRKAPCKLRVYALKSERDEQMHRFLSSDPNDPVCILERRYALAANSEIEQTPQEFWMQCQSEPWTEVLHVEIPLYSVVEIDDGLMPAFFYRTTDGLRLAPYFNAEKAQANQMEETV